MMGPDKSVLALLTAALLSAGCALGPAYQRPVLDLPAAYPDETDAGSRRAAVQAEWWKLYNDQQLNDLVASTLARNVDIKLAVAQVEEAEGVVREAGAAVLPEIDAGGNSNRTASSTATTLPSPAGVPTVRTDHRVAFSTTFELDFWGKLRNASVAAQARLLATRYARDVVMLTLASTTAQSYFALRSLDAQIVVTRESLATRESSLGIVRDRVKAGYASDLDLAQANVARANAAALLRDLQRQRALVEHQLQTLTGELGLRVAAGNALELPTPALPPPELPSTLVERRPDVASAEQNLISANAQIGVAKAAQFPTFSLTGFLGGESESLSNILTNPARIWSIGLGVVFPVFDAGRYAARTEEAEARQRQALASYQKTVELAFRDVADALANIRQSVATEEDLRAAAAAARDALRIAQARYQAGYSAYLDVLDAQRSFIEAELSLVRNRQTQLTYTVDLIKATGGGMAKVYRAVDLTLERDVAVKIISPKLRADPQFDARFQEVWQGADVQITLTDLDKLYVDFTLPEQDKTSLSVGPIVAACGVPLGKMSGRGLGHTGGTLDKLEAIPGFRVELTTAEFVEQVRDVGLAIVGQTANLVPADKLLYALRDVTATVDNVSLIAASIMSKKIAAGADAIVLDVKVGDGAFMKTLDDARVLAETMLALGRRAERDVVCVLTDMEQPLGCAVGNALEVREAVATLRGEGPPDFTELVLDASAHLLALSDLGIDRAEARVRVERAVADGSAVVAYERWVRAQGGDPDESVLPSAPVVRELLAPRGGIVQRLGALPVGVAALHLGAGRRTKDDAIDHAVGVVCLKKRGDDVGVGELLAEIHARDEESADVAAAAVLAAYELGDEPPHPRGIVLDTM
jgi:multidrug efflux system outer membrane protein